MNKLLSFFIVLLNMLNIGSYNESYKQYVNKSYIVLNSLNNQVIEGNNIHLQRSVASVSKIMTAIVAIENGDLNKEIEIISEDIDTYGSSIYLQVGDKITLLDLLYGLMLRSGNDAAKAIARSVSGSVEKFAALMNEKARVLGMKNSLFTNPSGLDVEETGNLSTSYDLALLMSYAIKNEVFLEISGSEEYKSERGVWSNKNKLLKTYQNTIAGKTGFTYKAKRTLVTAAKENENIFVVVTLDCGNDFNFHKFLYERNFDKYTSKLVLEKGDNYIDEYIVNVDKDYYITLEKSDIKNYSLIYKLESNMCQVYLVRESEEEKILDCEIRKSEQNIRKRGFFQKIIKFFGK